MRYMMLLSGASESAPPPPELFEAIMKLGGCRAWLAPGLPWPAAR